MNYSIGIENIVDFSPQDEITEILQNVRTIMATTKGSVPLDRDFGVSADYVDKPMAKAKATRTVHAVSPKALFPMLRTSA